MTSTRRTPSQDGRGAGGGLGARLMCRLRSVLAGQIFGQVVSSLNFVNVNMCGTGGGGGRGTENTTL